MPTSVFTDGACLGNPGPGGWAWAVEDGPYGSGASSHTTNQRMEVEAVLQAVRAIDDRLEVVSDSTYVVNCFRDRWWEGWIARGWLNKAKKPVANRDLWEPLIELVNERGDVTFRWVKGHAGDPMNDLVDRLAVEAATTQKGRSGTGRPADLGAADAPAAKAAPRGPALPEGHRVLVGGLRPPQLGGYGANPVADKVRTKLTEILAAMSVLHPDLLVVTGLGLGAEQLGAEAAVAAGLPYVAALPFPDPGSVWADDSQRHFADLCAKALMVVSLQAKAPESKQQAGAAIARRDGWLVREVQSALLVWDGEDDRVGKLVRSCVVALGEEEVWVVEPE